jgi:hypothetical protein
MKIIEFGFGASGGQVAGHTYRSRLEGEWIVFVCDECPGHERRVNWHTGRMASKGPTLARHSGFHLPRIEEMN